MTNGIVCGSPIKAKNQQRAVGNRQNEKQRTNPQKGPKNSNPNKLQH